MVKVATFWDWDARTRCSLAVGDARAIFAHARFAPTPPPPLFTHVCGSHLFQVVNFCSFSLAFMLTALLQGGIESDKFSCDVGCEKEYWQGFCGDNPCPEDSEYDKMFHKAGNSEPTSCGAMICAKNHLYHGELGLGENFNGLSCDQFDASMTQPDVSTINDLKCYDAVCDFYTSSQVDSNCDTANTAMGWAAFTGFLVYVFDYFLKFLAICGCAQNKGWCLENCAECFGRIALVIMVFLSLIFWSIGIGYATPGMMPLFMYSKGQSWFMWFAFSVPIYMCTFKKQKALFEEDYPGITCLPDNSSDAQRMDENRTLKSGESASAPSGASNKVAPLPQQARQVQVANVPVMMQAPQPMMMQQQQQQQQGVQMMPMQQPQQQYMMQQPGMQQPGMQMQMQQPGMAAMPMQGMPMQGMPQQQYAGMPMNGMQMAPQQMQMGAPNMNAQAQQQTAFMNAPL